MFSYGWLRMGAVLPCAYAAKLPSAYGPMALRATATPQFGHCGLALIRCSGPCGSRHGLALWLHLRMRMGAVLPCAYACRLDNFNLNCKQFYLQGPTLLKNTMPCSSVRICIWQQIQRTVPRLLHGQYIQYICSQACAWHPTCTWA